MSVTPLAQPPESRFHPADWQLLQRFWHPVAFTAEIADRPYPFKLLDLGLIAYRTSAGFTVALDRALIAVPALPWVGSKRTGSSAATTACNMMMPAAAWPSPPPGPQPRFLPAFACASFAVRCATRSSGSA